MGRKQTEQTVRYRPEADVGQGRSAKRPSLPFTDWSAAAVSGRWFSSEAKVCFHLSKTIFVRLELRSSSLRDLHTFHVGCPG